MDDLRKLGWASCVDFEGGGGRGDASTGDRASFGGSVEGLEANIPLTSCEPMSFARALGVGVCEDRES